MRCGIFVGCKGLVDNRTMSSSFFFSCGLFLFFTRMFVLRLFTLKTINRKSVLESTFKLFILSIDYGTIIKTCRCSIFLV